MFISFYTEFVFLQKCFSSECLCFRNGGRGSSKMRAYANKGKGLKNRSWDMYVRDGWPQTNVAEYFLCTDPAKYTKRWPPDSNHLAAEAVLKIFECEELPKTCNSWIWSRDLWIWTRNSSIWPLNSWIWTRTFEFRLLLLSFQLMTRGS